MVPAPPSLPNRFPCWCRAVYSFSGESRRDLGFIEGDLIECLNAGDGSWWMGRLWRDKRMVGLFPSNFVQVLEENFRPTTRSSSPMPDQSPIHEDHLRILGAARIPFHQEPPLLLNLNVAILPESHLQQQDLHGQAFTLLARHRQRHLLLMGATTKLARPPPYLHPHVLDIMKSAPRPHYLHLHDLAITNHALHLHYHHRHVPVIMMHARLRPRRRNHHHTEAIMTHERHLQRQRNQPLVWDIMILEHHRRYHHRRDPAIMRLAPHLLLLHISTKTIREVLHQLRNLTTIPRHHPHLRRLIEAPIHPMRRGIRMMQAPINIIPRAQFLRVRLLLQALE
ncbi:variant SH3 domain-containing protein [Rutstroemia sp. NJR-2017a BBW]|nr:variant SH3 domain-containing protein [Rutstroemia sp. NJR-2017a BBW]